MFDLGDGTSEIIIFFAERRNFLLCIEDRCVIFTECGTDLIGGTLGKFPAEKHCNHPGNRNIFGAFLTQQISNGNTEVCGNSPLDHFRRHVAGGDLLLDLSVQQILRLSDG